MSIDAARVQIRPWQKDDADALHRLVRESHASLSKWLAWCDPDYNLDDARAWIDYSMASWKERSAFPFAVVDENAGTLLGGVGLNQLDVEHRSANLGYWIGSLSIRRGFATAAAIHAARFGFDDLGLERIDIHVLPNNLASLAVAHKLRAKHEGTLAHGIVLHGEPHDAILLSLHSVDASSTLDTARLKQEHDD